MIDPIVVLSEIWFDVLIGCVMTVIQRILGWNMFTCFGTPAMAEQAEG